MMVGNLGEEGPSLHMHILGISGACAKELHTFIMVDNGVVSLHSVYA